MCVKFIINIDSPKTYGELRVEFQIGNNKGADQTAQMRRLVCAFVVSKQQSQLFSRRGPYNVEAHASWLRP